MQSQPVVISDDVAGSTKLVLDALDRRGWRRQVIECDRLLHRSTTIEVSLHGSDQAIALRDEEHSSTIRIYPHTRVLRRQPRLPRTSDSVGVDPAVDAFVVEQYRSALKSLFTGDAVWMNSMSADYRFDQNKLLGNRVADRVGLHTIPTVITDSPRIWRKFVDHWGRKGDIAVKPTSAWAGKFADDEDITLSIFTTRLDRLSALELADAIQYAPVILQPYVEKSYELRVTMVDGDAFACRIDSQMTNQTSTDWRRYDFANTPHSAFELSVDVGGKLVSFMRDAGLLYAAIDLIVTPSGDCVFVEANPAGQFGWIEELTGLPISDAIANWLLT